MQFSLGRQRPLIGWSMIQCTQYIDGSLLPPIVPTARVLTFGYDAYVADWRGVVS